MPFRDAFFKSIPELRSWYVTQSRDHFHNQDLYNRKPWELRRNGSSALWVVYSNTALCIYDTVQFAKAWRELLWLTSGDTCRYESSVMMAILVCGLLRYDAVYSRRFSQKVRSVRENRWISPAKVRGIITHGTTNQPLKRHFLYNLINPILLAMCYISVSTRTRDVRKAKFSPLQACLPAIWNKRKFLRSSDKKIAVE
jgi:hypothetical protein